MSMQDKIDDKSLMKTWSMNSLQNLHDMSNKQIIDQLFEIIN